MLDPAQLVIVPLGRPAAHIVVEGPHRMFDVGQRDITVAIKRIHPLDEFGQRPGNNEMVAFGLHLAHETVIAEQRLLEERQQSTVAD